jgi:allophanate hydrolase subunit 2
MDHIVYLDAQAKELENLLSGSKAMIIRGATGRKLPHGRVDAGDMLYFINNNAEGKVRAKAKVKSAFHSEKMTEDESHALVKKNQPKLSLTEKQIKRWAGKRYIVLIEVADVQEIPPFAIDKSKYGNMDDWLPVEKIESVTIK